MDEDDYIWYTDDNNNIQSVGYPIKNVFKEAGIPAITGGRNPFTDNNQEGCLAIPAGLVAMHSLVSELPGLDEDSETDMEAVPGDLYSQLLDVASQYKISEKLKSPIKSRKKRRRSKKNKTRRKSKKSKK